jgi:phage terminase large subunit
LTWKILFNDDLQYKSIFIISGTFVHHANELKVRMENLFRKKFPLMQLESKFTDLWIKNTNIKIFPSRNVKDLRGYTDVSYLFIDEADHFEPSVNSELLHAITRYEEKSNCTTIMVSTPNRPDGLFQSIEYDKNLKYHKIILDYTVGLGKIYDPLEIEKKKLEPEFPREYEGKYLRKIGNVFTSSQIENCIQLAEPLKEIPISNYNLHSVGVDFGFSSSRTAIVMTEHLKTDEGEDKIIVRFAEEYDKANPQTIVDICHKLYRDYWNTLFFVDGANRGAVNLMKVAFDESLNWDTKDVSPELMKVLPVNFTTEHKCYPTYT